MIGLADSPCLVWNCSFAEAGRHRLKFDRSTRSSFELDPEGSLQPSGSSTKLSVEAQEATKEGRWSCEGRWKEEREMEKRVSWDLRSD